MRQGRKRAAFYVSGLASLTLVASGPLAAAAAGPAAAATCPTGSVTFDTQNDVNGHQLVQNADNFGTGAITCFSKTGTLGQLTVTQADHSSNPTNPTSYPSDDYGCTVSFCSTAWHTASWLPAGDTTPPTVSMAMSNTGVNASDVYDYLIDTLFTDSTHTGVNPPTLGEVEVVLNAFPSYASAGFCVATTCGATSVTIGGTSWWRTFRLNASGKPDTIYVRNTPASSVTSLNMWNFYHDANGLNNCSGAPCYTAWYVASLWTAGSELWPRTAGNGGLGISVTSTSLVNLP